MRKALLILLVLIFGLSANSIGYSTTTNSVIVSITSDLERYEPISISYKEDGFIDNKKKGHKNGEEGESVFYGAGCGKGRMCEISLRFDRISDVGVRNYIDSLAANGFAIIGPYDGKKAYFCSLGVVKIKYQVIDYDDPAKTRTVEDSFSDIKLCQDAEANSYYPAWILLSQKFKSQDSYFVLHGSEDDYFVHARPPNVLQFKVASRYVN